MLLLCAHIYTWLHSKGSGQELLRLLLYLQSIPRLWGGGWEEKAEGRACAHRWQGLGIGY